MPYQVIISDQAGADIDEIVGYIRDVFRAPMTASKKYDLIMEVLLDILPEHPFWQHPSWGNYHHGQQVYVYNADHYRIFHVPDKNARQTRVLRVLHYLQNSQRHL